MGSAGVILTAIAIAVGLVGILVPLLPGTLLVWAAVAVWSFLTGTTASWVVLGVVSVMLGGGLLIKYLWPVKRMRAAEVGGGTLAAGGVLGVVGFFVIPVVGLVVGFVAGVYLAELIGRRDRRRAWVSTVHAVKGVALSVGVELMAGLLAAAVWVTGLALSP